MTNSAGRHRFITPAFARDDVRYAIGRVLLPICAAIMALHVVSVAVRSLARPGHGAVIDLVALLNAAQERSLASWWTSALLATCCLAAVAAAWLGGRRPLTPPTDWPRATPTGRCGRCADEGHARNLVPGRGIGWVWYLCRRDRHPGGGEEVSAMSSPTVVLPVRRTRG